MQSSEYACYPRGQDMFHSSPCKFHPWQRRDTSQLREQRAITSLASRDRTSRTSGSFVMGTDSSLWTLSRSSSPSRTRGGSLSRRKLYHATTYRLLQSFTVPSRKSAPPG